MTKRAILGSLLLLLAAPSAQAQAFPFFLDVDVCWGQLGNFANRGTQCDPIDPYTTNQTVFLVEAGGVTTQCTYDPFGGPGWVSAFQGTWSKSGNQVTMYSPEWNWYFVGALAGGGTSGGVMVDSYGLATPVQSQQGAWDGTKAGQAEWDACVNGMMGGGSDCATHPQWMPVNCTTTDWVWSSDRSFIDLASADANQTLWSGCAHSATGGNTCSLDGTGWVSVDEVVMAGCDTDWYHIGGVYFGNCGGHDGDIVRRLTMDPNGCYNY